LSAAATAPAGVASRLVAWRVLQRVHRDGAWAGPAVDRALRDSDLTARDRAFAANLAFQTLRWQGTLDWALGQVVRRQLDKVERDVLDVLRLGAWQLLYGQVPDRAAVTTAAEVARAVLPARAVGFVNGVLRGLARHRTTLPWPPSDTIAGQALRLGYPTWIVEAAHERFGAGAGAELDAGNRPAALTVRAREVEQARAGLTARGAVVTGGRLAPEALVLDGLTPAEVTAAFGTNVTIQDEASMVVGRIVATAVERGGTVLDVCAAPGGKSTHLAELGLQVTAADRHPGRLQLVTELADRLSVPLAAAVADGTRPPWRPAAFAGVLVDAPCSGLGVVRRRPELRWRRTADDVTALAALQGRLLDASARCVAPGGALVYSVCTWTTQETVDVVGQFLSRTPDFIAQDVPVDLAGAAPGPGLQLGSEVHGSDGMFIAVFRRVGASHTAS
jgi:16S rRNA (cytosine967-C5)-methyltransferase